MIHTIPLLRESNYQDYPHNRIFLIAGDIPTLIDSGHSSQRHEVVHALKQHHLLPEDIKRVYYTSGSADSIGNRSIFTHAEHFQTDPRSYLEQTQMMLHRIKPFVASATFSSLELFFIPPTSEPFTLVKDGDEIEINNHLFDIVSTGSRTIYIGDEYCFVGELPMGTYPSFMPDADAFQRIVSRAENLALGKVYSTFRDPFDDASWFFKQTQRFFQSFQKTAKFDLPLNEFCERDLGGRPDDDWFWAFTLLKFAPFFT